MLFPCVNVRYKVWGTPIGFHTILKLVVGSLLDQCLETFLVGSNPFGGSGVGELVTKPNKVQAL